eukprot:g18875.t1
MRPLATSVMRGTRLPLQPFRKAAEAERPLLVRTARTFATVPRSVEFPGLSEVPVPSVMPVPDPKGAGDQASACGAC